MFIKHKRTSVIKDLVTFLLSHVTTTPEDDLFLTDITLTNSIIIEAIKDFSPNSAGGPDGILTSLLINCANELALALKIILILFMTGIMELYILHGCMIYHIMNG